MRVREHVGVVGASGFVGEAVVRALTLQGANVTAVRAPRLNSGARDVAGLRAELRSAAILRKTEDLRRALAGCSVVVNAAGLATAGARLDDALAGANSLLPGLLGMAARPDARFIHVSSAAVQGRRGVLDESTATWPFSPYSTAKALGECLVLERGGETVCFRPTSVHGPGRSVTEAMVRVLRSPVASVAGRGDRPTPQVLVDNVADAIAFVATTSETPPSVVLQPWEGLTTGDLVRVLGGQEPRHVPESLARGVVAAGFRLARLSAGVAGTARRLEMMWFGQRQEPGWLDARWHPSQGHSAWRALA